MDREAVVKAVLEEKLIVIVRGVPGAKMIPLAEAMYQGGIRLIEITYSAGSPESWPETAGQITELVNHFGGDMLVGAGTVVTPAQVALTAKAGGRFIISPNVDTSVIEKTVELGLVSMPGALTPSEIQTAHLAGADFVKLFPVVNLGTAYIRAVRAPLPHIRLLAVGGVNEENIPDYLRAGVCGFGAGSNIVDKIMLEKDDYAGITDLAKRFVQTVKQEVL